MKTKAILLVRVSQVGLCIHLNSSQEVSLKLVASPHSRQGMLLPNPIHLNSLFLRCT